MIDASLVAAWSYPQTMRTTITFDDDVSAAVQRLRRERSIGVSEAVNDLIRRGLTVRGERREFKQKTRAMGLQIDVSNGADAIETLDGPASP